VAQGTKQPGKSIGSGRGVVLALASDLIAVLQCCENTGVSWLPEHPANAHTAIGTLAAGFNCPLPVLESLPKFCSNEGGVWNNARTLGKSAREFPKKSCTKAKPLCLPEITSAL
jgi:hypothetical protein